MKPNNFRKLIFWNWIKPLKRVHLFISALRLVAREISPRRHTVQCTGELLCLLKPFPSPCCVLSPGVDFVWPRRHTVQCTGPHPDLALFLRNQDFRATSRRGRAHRKLALPPVFFCAVSLVRGGPYVPQRRALIRFDARSATPSVRISHQPRALCA
jgi:hypothetical protein